MVKLRRLNYLTCFTPEWEAFKKKQSLMKHSVFFNYSSLFESGPRKIVQGRPNKSLTGELETKKTGRILLYKMCFTTDYTAPQEYFTEVEIDKVVL